MVFQSRITHRSLCWLGLEVLVPTPMALCSWGGPQPCPPPATLPWTEEGGETWPPLASPVPAPGTAQALRSVFLQEGETVSPS